MKALRWIPLLAVCLWPVGAGAADLYGCVINETSAHLRGDITSVYGEARSFDAAGLDVSCFRLPEGSYEYRTSEGRWSGYFTVSPENAYDYLGDEVLHWQVEIKEKP